MIDDEPILADPSQVDREVFFIDTQLAIVLEESKLKVMITLTVALQRTPGPNLANQLQYNSRPRQA
jgi:hypothetical protein